MVSIIDSTYITSKLKVHKKNLHVSCLSCFYIISFLSPYSIFHRNSNIYFHIKDTNSTFPTDNLLAATFLLAVTFFFPFYYFFSTLFFFNKRKIYTIFASYIYILQNICLILSICEELTHWKRLWCGERLKAGGEWGNREWDGSMASLTWWTWVWVSSRSW